MKRLSTLLAAFALSCLIALVLQLIPSFANRQAENTPAKAVISLAYGDQLNDENLVDYMARMPLDLGIRKLDWREPVLYADLYVRDLGMPKENIYSSIREIGLFGLESMRNVGKLMVRVYEGEASDAALLLAVAADRRMLDEESREESVESSEQFVRHLFHVQATPRWIERYEKN